MGLDELGITKEVFCLTESLGTGTRGKISLDEFRSALCHSVEGNDTALKMLMTMHEGRRTSAKVEATLESTSMDSQMNARLTPHDGHTRKFAVSDGSHLNARLAMPDSYA